MSEREAIDRGWYYVVEPDDGQYAPEDRRIEARDGRVLTRRLIGFSARVEVLDQSGEELPVATWLRAASAAGAALETLGDHTERPIRVVLGPSGTTPHVEDEVLYLDGPAVAASPSHHPIEAMAEALLSEGAGTRQCNQAAPVEDVVPRALFFESLMNSDMPHNDREISQGVLHMASPLKDLETEVVLCNVKMPIVGDDRPVVGLERLQEALASGPVQLVAITLLEGYWDGVQRLIRTLREQGCTARIAVGGVMPSLSPEHVACHLDGVSFICRGAGEYFLPALCRILGDTPEHQPLSAAQRQALLDLDGIFVVDRAGKALLAGNPAVRVDVEDLDAVTVDLSHLQARHIEGGIEISTSRGCVHKCSFCSILGRESYQARSADNVFELLDRYQARFRELYGDHIPSNAYRVHISDDDFGCDKERALTFLRALRNTPFRLSSIQVSVADLCRRENGRLLPEIDPDWLDALDPACFADHGKPIPDSDFFEDHKSRNWSSFLQIGVETFADRELVRLAKGYRREHIRAVVQALDARGIHMDAYFIVSNTDTSPSDLVEGLLELCRLKLRHPRHFHLRFPVVPHLVSYFPSASHRRKIRQGRADSMALRSLASVPAHPEFDYPFVDHDIPGDPWVAAAVDAGFLTDEGRYTASLERLRTVWADRVRSLPEGPEKSEGERLVRRLDDTARRLVLDLLEDARQAKLGHREHTWSPSEDFATTTAVTVLGPAQTWAQAYRRHARKSPRRLVVIPTWQCELRCRYCYIPKQGGRVMSPRTMERAVDLLLASDHDPLILQFFGGEALLEWELVQHGITYGAAQADAIGKTLSFIVSSNGWSLDAEKLAWLAQYNVELELSLDGDPETQNAYRTAYRARDDSYDNGIAPRAAEILASGLVYDVIMVVHPHNVDRMPDNFFHIADLGFRRIQINFALGQMWTEAQKASFADGLFRIGRRLREGWEAGDDLMMVNLEYRPIAVLLNGETTVDHDGTIYGGNAFLHETEHKEKFVVGHLDDLDGFDRFVLDAPTNEYLLKYSYAPGVTVNNLEVGRIMTSFMKWMQSQGVPGQPRHRPENAAAPPPE